MRVPAIRANVLAESSKAGRIPVRLRDRAHPSDRCTGSCSGRQARNCKFGRSDRRQQFRQSRNHLLLGDSRGFGRWVRHRVDHRSRVGRTKLVNSIRGLRHPVPWLGALYAVGASALLLRDPHVNVWTACPAQVLLGVGCPLCGGLRAWSDVLTGNLAAAFSENKLAAVLAVCAPIAILGWGMATRWFT
ncbi:MAG: DUF2752 domain-containing protein [Candidatus Nanopelagicales bacterium]